MTPFAFRSRYRAPSPAVVLEAFVDRDHMAAQDRAHGVAAREVLTWRDAGGVFACTSHVIPRRDLPSFVRPVVGGGLSYVEHLRWDHDTDTLEIEMHPDVLGGRAEIVARCQVVRGAPGEAWESYIGTASVELAIVGRRIERAIVAELERSLGVARETTQHWLDARARSR